MPLGMASRRQVRGVVSPGMDDELGEKHEDSQSSNGG